MPALSREIQRRFAGAALVVDVGAVIEQKASEGTSARRAPRAQFCDANIAVRADGMQWNAQFQPSAANGVPQALAPVSSIR
jgi:hypothetical protein